MSSTFFPGLGIASLSPIDIGLYAKAWRLSHPYLTDMSIQSMAEAPQEYEWPWRRPDGKGTGRARYNPRTRPAFLQVLCVWPWLWKCQAPEERPLSVATALWRMKLRFLTYGWNEDSQAVASSARKRNGYLEFRRWILETPIHLWPCIGRQICGYHWTGQSMFLVSWSCNGLSG